MMWRCTKAVDCYLNNRKVLNVPSTLCCAQSLIGRFWWCFGFLSYFKYHIYWWRRPSCSSSAASLGIPAVVQMFGAYICCFAGGCRSFRSKLLLQNYYFKIVNIDNVYFFAAILFLLLGILVFWLCPLRYAQPVHLDRERRSKPSQNVVQPSIKGSLCTTVLWPPTFRPVFCVKDTR